MKSGEGLTSAVVFRGRGLGFGVIGSSWKSGNFGVEFEVKGYHFGVQGLRMRVEGAGLRGHAVEVFSEVVVCLEPPDRERHEDSQQHRHFDQPENIVHLHCTIPRH